MPLLDKMVVVKEEWIALAILRLVEIEKCVVEGAGAAGLAAILAGHLDEFKDKKFVRCSQFNEVMRYFVLFFYFLESFSCCAVEILILRFLDVVWNVVSLLKDDC